MCSVLQRFPPPPGQGHMTVAEQQGEFVAVPFTDTTGEIGMMPGYPMITVTREMSRNQSQRETAKSAFLPHDETVWKRAMHAWYEHGVTGTFEEVVTSKEEGDSNLGYMQFQLSNEDLISKFTAVADWPNNPVRAFAWHPHTIKVAYALQDDSIRVHSGGNCLMPILKHKLQKNVANLAWQPMSASVLAVACQSCILIWHVEPTSLATRPSASSVQVLQHSGHVPVTSVAWHPDGSLLLSAAPTDTAILAWNVPMETSVTLRRAGGGGVSGLKWSPDGSKAACWNPSGTVLLFAIENDPIIYCIKFSTEQPYSGSDNSNKAIAVADMSEVELETTDGELVQAGGSVHSMEWDQTGERLAILFKGHDSEAGTYVAVFKTVTHPVMEVLPCGLVRGQDNETAHCISFKPKFEQGALLTVIWSSGRVGYIPLLYSPAEGAVHQQDHLPPHNGQAGTSLHASFR